MATNAKGGSLLNHATGKDNAASGAADKGDAGAAKTGQTDGGEGEGQAAGEGGEGGKAAGGAQGGANGEGEGGDAGAAKAATGEGGEGEKPGRPEWLKEDKFWDAEKGELKADLLHKNYVDLRAKVSRGEHVAPESPDGYKVAIKPEHMVALGMENASDDPLIKWFQGAAHEAGLSQEDFGKMVAGYAEMAASLIAPVDAESEIKALGPKGQAVIDETDLWATGLHEKGILSDADYAELCGVCSSAAGVRMINRIREAYGEKTIPPVPSMNAKGLPSKAELREMVNDPKYKTDTEFRAKVDADYDKVYGSQPAGESVASPI